MQLRILRGCILASFVLLTYITVTDAERSISFYSTYDTPPRLPLKQIVDVVVVNRVFGGAFVALTRDGSIISWGQLYQGLGLDDTASALTNVKSIFAVDGFVFCAITQDDTMYCWGGYFPQEIDSVPKPVAPITNAKEIFFTETLDYSGELAAYAVLRKDGSVVVWGNKDKGGDSSSVASQLSNVKHIAANEFAFAAIREDGSVVTWGKSDSGGDSSSVSSLLVDVVEIVSTKCAFAALTSNGDVASWGCSDSGGSGSMYRAQGVKSIHPIYNGFLAIRHNGSVVGWGTAKALKNLNGLDLNNIEVTEVLFSLDSNSDVYLLQADGSVAILAGNGVSSPFLLSQLSKDVKTIVAHDINTMYIAVKHDGSTVAWHNSQDDSIPSLFEDVMVDSLYPFYEGFVAVTKNNRVISRAHDLSFDSTKYVPHLSKIFVNHIGVTVLTQEGDVKSWPHNGLGSLTEYVPATNIKDIRSIVFGNLYLFNDGSFKTVGKYFPSKTQITKMSIGISKIFSTTLAFAALLNDGTVVAWGEASHGGDTSLVADKLNNVKMVYHNNYAFTALKNDGTVVSWGDENYGGNIDQNSSPFLQNVQTIFPLSVGFSALIGDNLLISWGDHSMPGGGYMNVDGVVADAACGSDSTSTCAVLHGVSHLESVVTTAFDRIIDVDTLAYSSNRYALLLTNGEVVFEFPQEIVGIQSQLVNVKSLHSVADSLILTESFVALKHDHTVVLWPKASFRKYDEITQYLDSNTVLSIYTTVHHYVAITKHLDDLVDEYVVFGDAEFMVVKDCRCELEVHDEFVLETSFRPTASPTSSPTAPSIPSPTSSPTLSTHSQLQENDNNSENLYIGIGVGTTAGLVIVAAMVAFRKNFSSPHQVDDVVLEKSLASGNPNFQA